MRYKVTLQYDGSLYHGWQIQPNANTVQKEVLRALAIINKKTVDIHASGRTDTHVHALNQVFHFDSDLDLESDIWTRALNGQLPDDIRIKSVEKVEDDFHARYDAMSKIYHYKLNMGDYNVFDARYVYQYNSSIDINKLKEVAQVFVGVHDFTSFNATPNDVVLDQKREIFTFEVDLDKDIITFKIEGSGFLRHMVRMLVASCIWVTTGRISLKTLSDALENPDKEKIKANVPGCGLYLINVNYNS